MLTLFLFWTIIGGSLYLLVNAASTILKVAGGLVFVFLVLPVLGFTAAFMIGFYYAMVGG